MKEDIRSGAQRERDGVIPGRPVFPSSRRLNAPADQTDATKWSQA
jgi:hypothetical protein